MHAKICSWGNEVNYIIVIFLKNYSAKFLFLRLQSLESLHKYRNWFFQALHSIEAIEPFNRFICESIFQSLLGKNSNFFEVGFS